MKRGSSPFIYLMYFLAGAVLCYLTLQFTFLEVNLEVNVVQTLLSILTAVIGLYIAVSIQKKNSRSQNLHAFLQKKLECLWEKFNSFDSKLSKQSSMKLEVATSSFKSMYQELTVIENVFKSFHLKGDCINKIEMSITALDDFITNELPVKSNVLQLKAEDSKQTKLVEAVHVNISNGLLEISNSI